MVVQKFDEPAQLGRDGIGHEQQSPSTLLKVLPNLGPEGLHPRFIARGPEQLAHLLAEPVLPARPHGRELANAVFGPVSRRIGRVLQHLTDDFATDPRVCGSFDLDESEDAVLIDQERIKRPPPRAVLPISDRRLQVNDQPPKGLIG